MRSYGVTNVAPYSAAPSVGAAGDEYWNTTTGTLYISNGTAWVPISPGTSPQVLQTRITNGQTVIANTELTLVTLNIPAQPIPYTLEVVAQFNAYATVTGETLLSRTKVDGNQTALLETRFSGVNIRSNCGISTSRLISIAANTASVASLTGQGSGATGNFGIGNPQESYLTARLIF
jgi:hypothetical protein